MGFFLICMSTFVGYEIPKQSSLKKSCRIIKAINEKIMGLYLLQEYWFESKQEFELTYFEAANQLFNHYTTSASPTEIKRPVIWGKKNKKKFWTRLVPEQKSCRN